MNVVRSLRGRLGRAWVLVLLLAPAALLARPFSVLVYNVENLFDTDGVSAYDDYQPTLYTSAHARTKLENIARVLASLDDGRGPDIILFQEIELDFTPEREPSAAALLLATLEAKGLRGYSVVQTNELARGANHENGFSRSVHNVIFTRFPVVSVRSHPTREARDILEAVVDVEGSPLYLFNNHWKSGASDPATEETRIQNATVLRNRLDELLKTDPHADIIIGGDLNSHYNHSRRYRQRMRKTGINDVLRSQGNELAIRGEDRDLYNLWFEVPVERRGSDTYQGEWGTLMHIILSRGLYDYYGIQYADNSFRVVAQPGLNVTSEGLPWRWNGERPAGSGFSDHFPLYARFVRVTDNRKDRWLALTRASSTDEVPAEAVPAPEKAFDLSAAKPLAELPSGADLQTSAYLGTLVEVVATVAPGPRLAVDVAGTPWEVWIPNATLRETVRARWKEGDRVVFYGVIGQYKQRWQFVIEREAWVSRN